MWFLCTQRSGISAEDNRCNTVSITLNNEGYVDVAFPEKDIAPYKHIIELCVPLDDGTQMHVTDYASAGKLWTNKSKMAAWMLTK